MNLTPAQFHKSIIKSTGAGRWCFAGALQPFKAKKMPDLVNSVIAFKKKFDPERIRVCFLSPTANERTAMAKDSAVINLVERLRGVEHVEYMTIDARDRYHNGLLLADFFDFN